MIALPPVSRVTVATPRSKYYQSINILQGSATVGVRSKAHVVLVALKRSSSELSSYQKKIYPVDDHVAVSIAGLTSDGRMLRCACVCVCVCGCVVCPYVFHTSCYSGSINLSYLSL